MEELQKVSTNINNKKNARISEEHTQINYVDASRYNDYNNFKFDNLHYKN